MSDSSGWWARHLNGQQSAPQGRPAPVPAYTPPSGPPAQQAAPQGPQQQQQMVETDNIFVAAQYWQGGQGTRTETEPCPKCGSGHYFSRSSGVSRGPAPAPTCYTCGYNGMFEQGDPAVWQAG